MRILALDTTTRGGSIAIVEGNRVVAERAGDPSRTHAERLPAEIHALLETCRLRSSDVDLFAVAAGPGSFTGLRIGIATIQGLALVHGRRVAALSALDALAHIAGQAVDEDAVVGAWMDAARGEVYAALSRRVSAASVFDEGLREIDPPSVAAPASCLDRWSNVARADTAVFTGDGAMRYTELIRARFAKAAILEPRPLAGAIGLMAASPASALQIVDPGAVRPLYVRRPDAELDRERRQERAR